METTPKHVGNQAPAQNIFARIPATGAGFASFLRNSTSLLLTVDDRTDMLRSWSQWCWPHKAEDTNMNAKSILQAGLAASRARNPHHTPIVERPALACIAVGGQFTFPQGTEDAGAVFTVIEDRGTRKLVRCENTGMAIAPMKAFDCGEEVVRL